MTGILFYRAPLGTASTTPILIPMADGINGLSVAPSTFGGTYRLIQAVLASATGYQLTITQNLNGVPVPGGSFTSQPGTAIGSNYVDLGEVTLPLVATPPNTTGITYTFFYSGGTATELMLLDTLGRLVWIPQFPASAYVWADEATAGALGGVWAGQSADETDAVSILGQPVPPQMNALTLTPGDNYFLVHCPDGLPANISASYAPRWLSERAA